MQNQSVLLWQEDQPGAEVKELLDPNTLSEDGTVALSGWSVSEDGKLLVYGLSTGGSDWTEWKVREIETGKDLGDHIKWVKFSSPSWKRDNSGLYYSRYPAPKEGEALEAVNVDKKVYFHKLGDSQGEDVLVYERPEHPKWSVDAWPTQDGRYLTISISDSTDDRNAFIVKDLAAGEDAPFVEVIPDIKDGYSVLGNDGSVFYFQTNLDAPNRRVISIDVADPDAKPVRNYRGDGTPD